MMSSSGASLLLSTPPTPPASLLNRLGCAPCFCCVCVCVCVWLLTPPPLPPPLPPLLSVQMRFGVRPEHLRATNATEEKHGLVLSHGYCSGGNPWLRTKEIWTDAYFFEDPNQSRSHDKFAQLIVEFAESQGLTSFSIIGHSQGGFAALHTHNYYWSGVDNARVRSWPVCCHACVCVSVFLFVFACLVLLTTFSFALCVCVCVCTLLAAAGWPQAAVAGLAVPGQLWCWVLV